MARRTVHTVPSARDTAEPTPGPATYPTSSPSVAQGGRFRSTAPHSSSNAQSSYIRPTGQGLKGKGLGLGKPQSRYRKIKILRDNLAGAAGKPTIRRLARRGGVQRISASVYVDIRRVMREHLERILKDVVIVLDGSSPEPRKTITVRDIIFALRLQGQTLYGFDNKPASMKLHKWR